MRRFTRDAIRSINGKDPGLAAAAENEWNRLVDEYRGYVDAHRAELPAPLLELSLHDAPVESLEILGTPTTVRVAVQSGHGPMCVVYEDVRRIEARWDRENPIFPGLRTAAVGAWLYDEVSVLPSGDFRHEIIFESGLELSVDFAKARVERP